MSYYIFDILSEYTREIRVIILHAAMYHVSLKVEDSFHALVYWVYGISKHIFIDQLEFCG